MSQGFDFNIYNVKQVDRVTFIRRTYSHVALAVLSFVIMEVILLNTPLIQIGYMMANSPILILALVLGGSWIATKWAQSPGNTQKQYMGLFLFTLVESIIFLPLFIILLTSETFAGQVGSILGQSAMLAGGLFTGLSAVALFSKTDFSFLRSIVTVGFMIALAIAVAGMLFGFDLGLWFSAGVILLSAGSILYQTSSLVRDYHTSQHVIAALGLFSSLMTMFYFILRIFMSRD